MVSNQNSGLSLKDGSNYVSTTLATDQLADDFSPSLNPASFPLPMSDVSPSGHQNPPVSGNSGRIGTGSATSNHRHSSLDENDVVIAIMGLTGAGKSTFVNTASGRSEVIVGCDLKSQTRAVQPIRCLHPDGLRNIVLVDTPGFDDTHLSDAQILRVIANWLKETYRNNIKLSGLLYLHRISDVRMGGTPLRNLTVFKDLCGDENLKNIVLVTTMWDEVEDQSVGFEREEELHSSFWKDMIYLGSRTCRYQGTRESAWDIIGCLDLEGSRQKRAPLQIQQEMVDRGLPLQETTAAKTLFGSLVKLAQEFRKGWKKARNKARWAAGPKEPLDGLRMRAALSRSPSIRSSSSKASWSVVSSTSLSSLASGNSTSPSSPASSTHSGCTSIGRRDTLSATIRVLKLAHQMADIAHVPMLRGVIGTVLHIAQLIEDMGGTHHAITQVIESSGWLLEEITRHAAQYKLSRDIKRTLGSFQGELNNLQNVVTKISTRTSIARFLLHDADFRAITACTTSIREIYDKLEVKLALDSRQAIARLEDLLTVLCTNAALWRCECGMWAAHEQSQENGQPSSSTSQSS